MKEDSPGSKSMLVIKGSEVLSLLAGKEKEIVDTVRAAYLSHRKGNSSLPHSTFLRFPFDKASRIIALPAYLGDGAGTAGIKWISSFPANLDRGLDRASAVLVLNSVETGMPYALLEGSVISAKRTAASAALAATALRRTDKIQSVALLGCGLINFEVLRFLRSTFPGLTDLTIMDLSRERAKQFEDGCQRLFGCLSLRIAGDIDELLASAPLVVMATTASRPHISNLAACPRGTTILDISL
ncbi:MAG TPA: 2,3-diaminopropionate biosynthesis protein SbnB, partial [Blastocatellia bacterium]|nr:2,3-diaminopropionate biosynthesis protein SbnB [Blastocatellia bacterium]